MSKYSQGSRTICQYSVGATNARALKADLQKWLRDVFRWLRILIYFAAQILEEYGCLMIFRSSHALDA